MLTSFFLLLLPLLLLPVLLLLAGDKQVLRRSISTCGYRRTAWHTRAGARRWLRCVFLGPKRAWRRCKRRASTPLSSQWHGTWALAAASRRTAARPAVTRPCRACSAATFRWLTAPATHRLLSTLAPILMMSTAVRPLTACTTTRVGVHTCEMPDSKVCRGSFTRQPVLDVVFA